MDVKKHLLFIVAYVALTTLACTNNKSQKECKSDYCHYNADYITDSISLITDRKIKRFGNDSLYEFYDNSILYSITYLDTKSIITEKFFYKDGLPKIIRYNCSCTKDSLREEIFYPNTGKLWQQTYCKDTIIITDGNPRYCHELYISYYENGIKEFIGYFGHVDGQISAIGTQKHFDTKGLLSKTEEFIYPSAKRPYVIRTEYYTNGYTKSVNIYINNELHEGDIKEPIGVWLFYNESGKLIKIEKYSSLP